MLCKNWKSLILAATLLAALLCGCGRTPEAEDETAAEDSVFQPAQAETEPVNMEAVEFLKLLYTQDHVETATDYLMIDLFQTDSGNIYKVVWSVDVSQELVKIVPGDNGTVTVDVNELCQQDTPYTLTASIATAEGHRITHSWHYILPKTRDMAAVVEQAYAMKNGDRMPGRYTLTGTVSSIEKAWSENYQNVSLIIRVEGCEDKPVRCYGLTGQGVKDLQLGDVITVTGVLKKYDGGVEFDTGCTLEPSKPEETVSSQ